MITSSQQREPVRRERDSAVQSLMNGLAILASFDASASELGLNELAQRTGLTKRTTLRLAATLERLGYLERSSTSRRYRLGIRILDLGFSFLATLAPREAARPWLEWLLGFGGQAANFAVLDGTDVVYVEHVMQASSAVRIDIPIGSRRPVHFTSVGKALLAFLPPAKAAPLLAQLDFTPRTPASVRSLEALRRQLEEVRRRGFALNHQEMSPGVLGIAAPIFGTGGELVGAINLIVFIDSTTVQEQIRGLAPRVREAAAHVSEALGYRAGR